MHVHLDPVGGVAGDMFVAALLDAFPERAEALAAALAESRLPEIVLVRPEPFTDGILQGHRFQVAPASGIEREDDASPAPGDHGHHHHDHHDHHHHHDHEHHPDRNVGRHDHRRFADIRVWLGECGLAAPVTERADAIFTLLAEAEAEVHGIRVADVTFHEVGAWDSIADVVCAAWLIDSLGAATWSCAPLPLGGGQVRTEHGMLPVPAPATALLLRGVPSRHDGVDGERVTPTGASILRHLEPTFDLAGFEGRITRTGHGFGTRRLPGMSNVLRALVLEPTEAGPAWREEVVGVCAFEVDDQSAEDLAVGLDRLRAIEGVLDVVQAPAYGKKGRMVASVRVLARPGARERVIEACFAETATLGVRWQGMRRAALEREEGVVRPAGGDSVRVKRARRPGGGVTVKAEMDDLAGHGRAEREERRRKAESE